MGIFYKVYVFIEFKLFIDFVMLFLDGNVIFINL